MEFKLPELGEGVHEGELVKWKVKAGDPVKYDQALCEIMTDKATVEIPSAFQGNVGELHVKEGDVVHVGQLMLSFAGAKPVESKVEAKAKPESKSEAKPEKPEKPEKKEEESARLAGAESVGNGKTVTHDMGSRPLAAPSTRRMAREMGVDLSQLQGSGPQGRILKEDLMNSSATSTPQAARGPQPTPTRGPVGQEERVPFRGLRKKISEKMHLSKSKAAHFTYVEEADATALVQLRGEAKEIGIQKGIKVTFLPFIMKAMVAALRSYPVLNSTLDEEKAEIVYKHYYNIGLSIQTEDGLVAPVVKDVAHKSILQLAKEIQDLVDRARHKRLTMDDLQGSTITLTNAGSIGGLFATPVINYPEVAILGFNKIFRKPVVKVVQGKEEIVIRDWTYFSLSLDHRIVDGAIGAEFMKRLIQMIENPSLLLLDSV